MIFRKQNNLFLASYFVPLKIWPIITARIFPHLKAEPIHQKSVFKFILFEFVSSEVKNAVNLSTFSEFPVKQKFKAFLFLKSSYLFVCLSLGLLVYSYFGVKKAVNLSTLLEISSQVDIQSIFRGCAIQIWFHKWFYKILSKQANS